MDFGIRGRRALLAGASAGMGKHCAIALAQEGADLYISARTESRLLSTAEEIARTTGARVTPVVADHSTAAGREILLAACPAPEIMVITSSPPRITEDFLAIESVEWTRAIDTGFLGPLELMREVVGGMKERNFGRIVNIATIGVKSGLDQRVLSGAPKAALVNYAASIARPLSRFNIAINTILPGMFETPGMEKMFNDLAEKNGTTYASEYDNWRLGTQGNATGRFGDPEDVGALCTFLCSRYASYIIGQSIVIDGGKVRTVF
jgi:3-oxoacyl-[acyl-carrier protein] reductase